MSRFMDAPRRRSLRDITPREMERMEAAGFERDFARSRHNRAMRECRCSGPGSVCSWCPERDALTAATAQEDHRV